MKFKQSNNMDDKLAPKYSSTIQVENNFPTITYFAKKIQGDVIKKHYSVEFNKLILTMDTGFPSGLEGLARVMKEDYLVNAPCINLINCNDTLFKQGYVPLDPSEEKIFLDTLKEK